jgi:hypothetical protein
MEHHLRLLVTLLESLIMILLSSIMFLEKFFSTGITHADNPYMLIQQATGPRLDGYNDPRNERKKNFQSNKNSFTDLLKSSDCGSVYTCDFRRAILPCDLKIGIYPSLGFE